MPYPDNFDSAAFDRRWGHDASDEETDTYNDLAEQQDDGKRHDVMDTVLHTLKFMHELQFPHIPFIAKTKEAL